MKDLDLQHFMNEMMAAGAGGFSAAAPAEGPVAGFDPLMSKTDKVLRRNRKKKKKKVEEGVISGIETSREIRKNLADRKKKEMEDAPSIKDAKPATKTNVKNYPGLGIAPTVKEDLFSDEEIEALAEKVDGKSAKDKGYSLHDWFKGGGWKQTGGKYDGKPCAKQPGQTTKPYCRDADDRKNMSKDERDKRAAKKRREDPDADRSGKAKMVTQKEGKTWSDFLEEKDACYHKVKASAKVWPSAYASGRLVQCRKKGAGNYGKSKKK